MVKSPGGLWGLYTNLQLYQDHSSSACLYLIRLAHAQPVLYPGVLVRRQPESCSPLVPRYLTNLYEALAAPLTENTRSLGCARTIIRSASQMVSITPDKLCIPAHTKSSLCRAYKGQTDLGMYIRYLDTDP